MSHVLLSRHHVVSTTDVEEAQAVVGRAFCTHALAPTRGTGLGVVFNSGTIGSVGLNYLRYGAEVRITPGMLHRFYLVQIPLAGRARVSAGRSVVHSDPATASVLSPDDPIDMVWSADCEQLLVYVERHALERYVQSDPGDVRPVRFEATMALHAPRVRSWLRLVSAARGELESPDSLLQSPLVAAHIEQALIGGLLGAQPHVFAASMTSEAPSGPGAEARERIVRAAEELIEALPEHPWRIAELSERIGVSSRTLQQAFRAARGMSPLERLRRTRMGRVHEELLRSDPRSTTVTQVAGRWGFFHMGHFSQAYRAAFEEPPSTTLAR